MASEQKENSLNLRTIGPAFGLIGLILLATKGALSLGVVLFVLSLIPVLGILVGLLAFASGVAL